MTKNQHIIPKFYQMFWDCGDKYVWRLDKQRNFINRKSIGTNCSGDYVYEDDPDNPDNEIENLFNKQIETPCSKSCRTLVTGYNCFITVPENIQQSLCKLFANILTRRPEYIFENPNKNMLMDKTEQYYGLQFRRKVLNNLALMHYMDLYYVLLAINATIYVSNEPKIVFCNQLSEQVLFAQNKLYMPLSPHLLIIFDNTKINSGWTVQTMSESIYNDFLSRIVLNQQVEYVYANNNQTISIVQNYLHNNCTKQSDNKEINFINYISTPEIKERIKLLSHPLTQKIHALKTELRQGGFHV